MATSKSTSKRTAWSAGASVFSGRPDPVWEVKPALAARLEKIWRSLKPSEIEPPPEPSLGYRGCSLNGPRSRQWFAFAGVVTLRSSGRPKSRSKSGPEFRSEFRRDPAKKFERTLLASAPAALLPPWLDT
ncbi:MAG TPA: hypothetical protein VIX11_18665 [Candidatus Acidoferrum sp.]